MSSERTVDNWQAINRHCDQVSFRFRNIGVNRHCKCKDDIRILGCPVSERGRRLVVGNILVVVVLDIERADVESRVVC